MIYNEVDKFTMVGQCIYSNLKLIIDTFLRCEHRSIYGLFSIKNGLACVEFACSMQHNVSMCSVMRIFLFKGNCRYDHNFF